MEHHTDQSVSANQLLTRSIYGELDTTPLSEEGPHGIDPGPPQLSDLTAVLVQTITGVTGFDFDEIIDSSRSNLLPSLHLLVRAPLELRLELQLKIHLHDFTRSHPPIPPCRQIIYNGQAI